MPPMKVCAGCGDAEYRIDGFCSSECRDYNDLHKTQYPVGEADKLRAQIERLYRTAEDYRSKYVDQTRRVLAMEKTIRELQESLTEERKWRLEVARQASV